MDRCHNVLTVFRNYSVAKLRFCFYAPITNGSSPPLLLLSSLLLWSQLLLSEAVVIVVAATVICKCTAIVECF